MRGFLRLVIDDEESGNGVIKLRKNELLGLLLCGPTTQGMGSLRVFEDNEEGRVVARARSNDAYGQEVYGPFEHISKTLYWECTGTGNHVEAYAWHDAEGKRSQF